MIRTSFLLKRIVLNIQQTLKSTSSIDRRRTFSILPARTYPPSPLRSSKSRSSVIVLHLSISVRLCVSLERSIRGRTRAYASPLRSSSFYTSCARTLIPDSLSLSPCFLPPPTHGAHCPSASRLHRNTVTYPHGNRYSARGYRTLISSCRTHIPGFVETVHRTVSFGYSRDT